MNNVYLFIFLLQQNMPIGRLFRQKVIIEVRRGITFNGDVAVDDIIFEDCDPPTDPPDGKIN